MTLTLTAKIASLTQENVVMPVHTLVSPMP